MKRKVFVLDDTCGSLGGGTSLTLHSIAESLSDLEFSFIETSNLKEDLLRSIDRRIPWVIGNTMSLGYEQIKCLFNILQYRRFVKIEFDYGFCKYRCRQGFTKFAGIQDWKIFEEPHGSSVLKNIYDLSHRFASSVLYMSEEQLKTHKEMLEKYLRINPNTLVLGSCFSPRHMMSMLNVALKNNPKPAKKTWAVIDGNGGWHSEAKGVKNAIAYCRKNNLDFGVIRESNYEAFLDRLSRFTGLVSLPAIDDTCPRVTIEAKLMGLDLVTNENSQHAREPWFSLPPEEMANHLLERPYVLRKELEKIL
jgi:hypothetical protein